MTWRTTCRPYKDTSANEGLRWGRGRWGRHVATYNCHHIQSTWSGRAQCLILQINSPGVNGKVSRCADANWGHVDLREHIIIRSFIFSRSLDGFVKPQADIDLVVLLSVHSQTIFPLGSQWPIMLAVWTYGSTYKRSYYLSSIKLKAQAYNLPIGINSR